MIEMPRRSVTRFFIPLIDVLLLLFCIFLLMPMVGEEETAKNPSTADLNLSVKILKRDLEQMTQDLQKFESLRPELEDIEKLKEELERLRLMSLKNLQQRAFFQVLDIEGKTGDVRYFDTAQPDAGFVKITDEKTAHVLIGRHKKEAGKREVYYYFLYPRPETGFPTLAQERQYKKWFAQVANSLKETGP